MTVCVAAIAEKSMVIGMADRMLTTRQGEIEFEPEQGKFWLFPQEIVALIAGDAAIQGELMKQVGIEVKSWKDAAPKQSIRVKDVAQCYCQKFRELRREWAESEILLPLGLDLQTFLSSQTSLDRDLVNKIYDQLVSYEFPSPQEVIFMGMDHDGPAGEKGAELNYAQLYVTYNDRLSWLTTVGFVAIGIGKNQAESQFTFTTHWPIKPFHETLLLTYAAKKRAESASGVGKETDIIILGPNMGQILKVDEEHLKQLDQIYQDTRVSAAKAVNEAQQKTKEFVDKARADYEQRVQAEAERLKKEAEEKKKKK